jgi:hypothetical protein
LGCCAELAKANAKPEFGSLMRLYDLIGLLMNQIEVDFQAFA